MAVAILDTSVYIDHWERGLYQDTLENLRRAYIIRHSAVVLSELRRGARGRDAQLLVNSLFELATVRWNLPRPTGGRQGGSSEPSVTSKPGT
jgi:predicted nucleic acid-binding protein